MGQKVHPYGFRLGYNKNWISRWFAKKDYPAFVYEDNKIRKFVKTSLFHAGIRPGIAARRLTHPACVRLVAAIKKVLNAAITAGGSSLRDYVATDGTLGYFQLQTRVYDRANLPCRVCGTAIRRIVQGARATYYCPTCQR